MPYSIYIQENLGTYNIFNIEREDVENVVTAFVNNNPNIFLHGKRYSLKNVNEFRIFYHDGKIGGIEDVFKDKTCQDNGYVGTNFFGISNYITIKGLELMSEKEVTNEFDGLKHKKMKNEIKSSIKANDNIFIVHGHDEAIKQKVARFIEKLRFKPIILSEQTNLGMTIIEKLDAYSNVGFGIVLYTACDLGAKKGEEGTLKPRARQNVVFEHGYLIGKLGRNKVWALVENGVETPTDISGVVYVPLDDNNAWEMKLAKELKAAGYAVDMNLTID